MEILFLCLKVFFARIIDVSLGTFRTVTVVKGKSKLAALIGFIEILIWFLVVKEALNTDSNSIWIGISYAAGFSCGTLLGSYISQKFITGNVTMQVITNKAFPLMVDKIREHGYAVTVMNSSGKDKQEEKYMLFIEINKKEKNNLEKLIKQYDEKAFIVVNESVYVANGYFKNQVIK